MRALRLAASIFLAGLGSAASADDAGAPPAPPSPPAPSPTASAPSLAVPDPSPFLAASGAQVVGLSYEGSKLFFTRRVAGVVQLFVTDPDGNAPRQLTHREQSLAFAVPAPDGSKAVVGYDRDGDENTGLFLVDVAGTSPELELSPIDGVQRGSVVWTQESDRIFYRANDRDRGSFRIHARAPSAEADDVVVFDAPGSWRVEDAARGGDRLLLVRERSNRDASLYLLHLASHALTEIHPSLEGTTGAVGKALFVGDGSTVVFTQEFPWKDRPTYRHAWLAWLGKGETRRTPAVGDGTRHGCTVFEGEAEDLAVLGDDWVYVRKNAPGAPDRLAIANVHDNEEVGTLRCPPGELSGLYVDDKGRAYSTRSSPSDPGSIVRWDTLAGPRTVVRSEPGALDEASLPGEPKFVEVKAADGTEIRAWLWLPRGREPKGLPFILSIHGGPEGEDRPGWHPDRAYLLSLGFGVLAPNVRGSTGRGREFRDADDGAKRIDAVRDAKAAADWLVEQGYADPKRLGVMGGSYGGYMVMALLTEFPDTFAAGAEAVGIVNLETFLEKTSAYRRALREAEYGSLADRELLRSLSPVRKLDRIRAPLLVAHGENDPRVPVGEARQIEAEMKRLGRPVESLYFPDEGHGWKKLANRRKHLETLARFFSEHLAPPR